MTLAPVRIALIVMLWLVPGIAYAQDAAISGAVTDSTGGVLPGVTLAATQSPCGFRTGPDIESGNECPIPRNRWLDDRVRTASGICSNTARPNLRRRCLR